MPFSLPEFGSSLLLQEAVRQFFGFTLVVIRISGVMTTAPGFASTHLPINIRILLVLALAMLVSPAVPRSATDLFPHLDSNGDGRLVRTEVPEQLQPQFEADLLRSGRTEEDGLSAGQLSLVLELPPSLLDYAWIGAGEFGIGLGLGLGVMTILSGLQLTGQLIDQQTGAGLGEVFNPELAQSSSMTGDFLYLLGTLIFLLLGGHLLIVSSLVRTFQALPLGTAFVSLTTIELLTALVQQSLWLSLQAAAPLLAVMALVSLAMGFLGHTVPQINVLVVGFPVRVLIGFSILALSLAGIGERLVAILPVTIEQLTSVLSGFAVPLDPTSLP